MTDYPARTPPPALTPLEALERLRDALFNHARFRGSDVPEYIERVTPADISAICDAYESAERRYAEAREALVFAAYMADQIGEVDLHDAAYEIAQTRDVEEPDDDCYVEAFIRAARSEAPA